MQSNPQHAAALTLAGYIHLWGVGRPVDFAEAIRLSELAVKLGYADGMALRARMHLKGQGSPVNYQMAITLFEKAIALGNANAMSKRALMHASGQGGAINFAAAFMLYDKAIALGDANAMNNRAVMYSDGQGGPVDITAAVALYERAIALGNSSAMNNLAMLIAQGHMKPIDVSKEIALYEQAIALGNVEAMANRAIMHKTGQGGPVNLPAAQALYERAIALQDANAMLRRAIMHRKGQGGPVDSEAAAELLYCASQQRASLSIGLNNEVEATVTKIKRRLRSEEFTQTHYYLAMIRPTEIWRKEPVRFLACLARDKYMSCTDQLVYVDKIITTYPGIVAKVNDPGSINLLGEHYYQRANKVLKKEWLNCPDHHKKREALHKATKLLKQVPLTAQRQGDACYDIAYHWYQYYSAIVHLPLLGLLQARPYLERGMKLDHLGCQGLLEDILKLHCEQRDIFTVMDKAMLRTLLEEFEQQQLGAQLLAIVRGISLTMDYILYRNKQSSKGLAKRSSFQFWLKGNVIETCQRQLLNMIKQDHSALQELSNATEISSLKERYLTFVTTTKQALSHYPSEVSTCLGELEVMLQAVKPTGMCQRAANITR